MSKVKSRRRESLIKKSRFNFALLNLFIISLFFGLISPQLLSQNTAGADRGVDESRRKLNTSIQRLVALIGEGENRLTPAEVVAAAKLLRRSMRNEELSETEAEWLTLIQELVDKKLDVVAYRQGMSKLEFTGTLEVNSMPPGATILLDGVETGFVTPNTFSVSAGEHRVEAQLLPEYRAFNPQSVTVETNKRVCVDFPLVHVGYGALLIGSRPLGAAIYLDGKRMGDTPQKLHKLLAGQHHLRLVKGNAEYNETIEVQRDEVTKIIGELKANEQIGK